MAHRLHDQETHTCRRAGQGWVVIAFRCQNDCWVGLAGEVRHGEHAGKNMCYSSTIVWYQHLVTCVPTCCRPSLASVDHLATDGEIPLEHVLSLGVLSPSAVQHPKIAASGLLNRTIAHGGGVNRERGKIRL